MLKPFDRDGLGAVATERRFKTATPISRTFRHWGAAQPGVSVGFSLEESPAGGSDLDAFRPVYFSTFLSAFLSAFFSAFLGVGREPSTENRRQAVGRQSRKP